jgi:aminomethyltransferase
MVVNAGNIEKDEAWLRAQQPQGCVMRNRSDEFALLALQGPLAQQILARITDVDLPSVRFYHFAEGTVAGVPAIVSRTGYTGEDGFEVFVAPEAVAAVWTALMDAGRADGLVPAGLGARDTLRLEARMCLYGNDIDETTTLVEAGLGWIVAVDLAKGEYPGREVLAEQKKNGPPRKLVGFEVLGRNIARHRYSVHLDGHAVGAVTSGTYGPYVKKNIGLCYLPAAQAGVGTELEIDVRGRRVPARVVPTPFYKRAR